MRANLSKGMTASRLCEQLRAEDVVCEPSHALSNEFVRVSAGMQALLGKVGVLEGQSELRGQSQGWGAPVFAATRVLGFSDTDSVFLTTTLHLDL